MESGNRQANALPICTHEFVYDVEASSSRATIWRCEKCKAVAGSTIVPANFGGAQKSNLPSA